MAFNLGAFAGGIGSGIEQGQDIRKRYQDIADAQRQKIVEGVAAQAQQALQTGPLSPPSPGSAAPQQPPPGPVAPQPAQIPGAQPLPPGAPGAAPAPAPQGAAPGGPPPVATKPPTPGPAPAPGPAAPAAAGGTPAQADPMAVMAQLKQQAHQEVAGRWQAVMKAAGNNPEFKRHPELAWQAVNLMIDQDTKVGASDKALMTLENNILRDQLMQARIIQTGQLGEQRNATGQENADTRKEGVEGNLAAKGNELAERIRNDDLTHQDRAQRNALYGELGTMSHEDRLAAIEAMNQRATNALTQKDREFATGEADKMSRLDEAIEHKDWATVQQIQSGDYKAQTSAGTGAPGPAPKVAAPPGLRGGGAAPAAGGAYKSAEDVRQAFHDGKISKEQAVAALKPFGYN